ncbi:Thromboxane-A synthase [Mactra antiquata]
MEVFGMDVSVWNILLTVFIIWIVSIIFEWVQILLWRRKYKLIGRFPFPLFGTMPYIWFKDYMDLEKETIEKYGPVSFGSFGALNVMDVSDPDILKQIFIKEHFNFMNRYSFGFEPHPLDKMLITLKDTDWKRVRNIMTPTFSAGKLKKMTPEMNHCTRLLINGLVEKSKAGEVVDVRKHFGCFTMDVIAGTAFGIRPDSYNNPEDSFVMLAQKVFGQNTLGPTVLLAMLFPRFTKLLVKLFNISVFYPLDSVKFFSDVIRNIIKERKEKNDTGRSDLLQLMLNAELVEDGQTKTKLTEDEILAQGFIVFVAGYETTAALLGFMSYVLATQPDIQDKLIAEIDEKVPNDESDIKYDTVMDMPYLDQVINETLRMYPPVGRMDRAVGVEEGVQINGYSFPSGTSVGFSIYMMHHNKKYFPEPDAFKPERFSAEEKAKRDPIVFMPFGHGPRNCIGMRLASVEVKIAIVGMLRKLRFVKCEETEENLQLDILSFVKPKNPIKVKVELR